MPQSKMMSTKVCEIRSHGGTVDGAISIGQLLPKGSTIIVNSWYASSIVYLIIETISDTSLFAGGSVAILKCSLNL